MKACRFCWISFFLPGSLSALRFSQNRPARLTRVGAPGAEGLRHSGSSSSSSSSVPLQEDQRARSVCPSQNRVLCGAPAVDWAGLGWAGLG